MRKLYLLLLFFVSSIGVMAQKNVSLKDSLDGKLDLSDWVLKANGFIPVPMLITEPALGDIGGGLFAVFVDQNTPYLDSINGQIVKTRVKPNIYGGGAAYTANGSWLVGGLATGVIKKWRSIYRVGTGYADINLEFYKELPIIGEQSFEFNLRTFPLHAQLIRQFGRSDWFAGLNYLFLNTRLERTNSEFNTPKEANSNVSRFGILIDYDGRDNIFTPNKGFRWNTLVAGSSDFIGSDYKFTSINSAGFGYIPLGKSVIAGFRAEYQQIFGDFPFYMMPYLNLRGIPVMRYQGEITTLAETEWRWDFSSRYSLVAFGGMGKAFSPDTSFGNADLRISGGAGGRYLIARKLKLRMGVDVAHGPESWAYYIVLGTNWMR